MVELLGSSYVIDHCEIAYTERQHQKYYDIYVTDSLYALIQLGSSGKAEMKRYYDYLYPKKEDNRSGQEIADDIIARHGLKAVN